ARNAFTAEVNPRIGALLDTLNPELGVEIRHLLAYRMAADARSALHEKLKAFSDDPIVAELLTVPHASIPVIQRTDDELFFSAWQARDWAEVQRLGLILLPTHQEIAPVLARSLEWVPNSVLRDSLAAHKQSRAQSDSVVLKSPQTWTEW